MLEEDAEEIRTYHACERRDCSRVFRESNGYSDWLDGEFNDSRGLTKACPRCGSALYLAYVDHAQKAETWECPQSECDFSEDSPSPSGR